MPLLSARKPRTISQSIASLLGSSSQLSPEDTASVEQKAAQTVYHSALAQKAMEEVNREREANTLRRDPDVQARYGANVAGMTEPQGMQLSRALRGMVAENPVANDDEGNALPAAPYQPPSDVSPTQVRSFQTAIASTLANILGTGKTNADQMTQAGGNLLTQQIRERIAAEPDPAKQNQLGAAIKPGYREPYSGGVNAQGITVNQETGGANVVSQPLLDAALTASEALTGQREASATASEARAIASEARALATRGGGRGAAQPKAPSGYRWTEDANGEPALEPIPGGPKDAKNAPGKPLPSPAVKRLEEAGTSVEDTRRLASTFKDKYGGNTILGGMANTLQRTFGDVTPSAIAADGQAQWWQDMDMLQNQVRHTLFGSALTATELAAWNKTSITPRMDPKEIRDNLKRRQGIEERAASKVARSYEAAGYNQTQIRELLGTAAEYLNAPAPPAVQRGASGSWDGQDRRAQPRGAAPTKRVVVDF